ncbi:hypothetical protein JCM10212_002813 [Sporobolomyces blumeae]
MLRLANLRLLIVVFVPLSLAVRLSPPQLDERDVSPSTASSSPAFPPHVHQHIHLHVHGHEDATRPSSPTSSSRTLARRDYFDSHPSSFDSFCRSFSRSSSGSSDSPLSDSDDWLSTIRQYDPDFSYDDLHGQSRDEWRDGLRGRCRRRGFDDGWDGRPGGGTGPGGFGGPGGGFGNGDGLGNGGFGGGGDRGYGGGRFNGGAKVATSASSLALFAMLVVVVLFARA